MELPTRAPSILCYLAVAVRQMGFALERQRCMFRLLGVRFRCGVQKVGFSHREKMGEVQ